MTEEYAISMRPDYGIGSALDISFKPRRNPFTSESHKIYDSTFEQRKNSEEEEKNYDIQQGKWYSKTVLTTDSTEVRKALGIEGSLKLSYGPISGDAKVEFAKKNARSSLDVTFIITATQKGRTITNSTDDLNKLELAKSIKDQINNNEKYTIQDFKKEYGEYYIIGFEYGGEIIFQSTYSTESTEDKLAVEGALNIRFAKAGLEVSGGGAGKYKNVDVSKKAKFSYEEQISPSYDTPIINGDDGILPLLVKISKGESSKHDTKSLDSVLKQKMQKLLAGKQLNITYAIIVNMDNVPCVDNIFKERQNNAFDIKTFCKFASPLYMELNEIYKTLEKVRDNYNQYDPENIPNEKITKWFEKINKKIQQMNSAGNNIATIYEYANKKDKYDMKDLKDSSGTKKVQQISKKRFYMMNKDILRNEFRREILQQYDQMIANKKTHRVVDVLCRINPNNIHIIRNQSDKPGDTHNIVGHYFLSQLTEKFGNEIKGKIMNHITGYQKDKLAKFSFDDEDNKSAENFDMVLMLDDYKENNGYLHRRKSVILYDEKDNCFSDWTQNIQLTNGQTTDEFKTSNHDNIIDNTNEMKVTDVDLFVKQRTNLIQLILDSLGINHTSCGQMITENYMRSLGDCDDMSEDNIIEIMRLVSSNILTPQIDKENNIDFLNIPKTIFSGTNNIKNGFLMNQRYLRTLVDAVKCRVKLEPFISFDLGSNQNIEISVTDLIVLLLEISDINTHKKLLIPIIERQLPIPIVYNMTEIKTNTKNKNKICKIKYFSRDIMHLVSQCKILCDGMSQTEIIRDRPLVMFVGSDKVNGKSNMLMNLYDNQKFNVLQKKNSIHNSSIDIVFLPDRHKVNYHIIDVHGKIIDPLFYQCTNGKFSRMNLLTKLASLCHIIVFEINENELGESFQKTNENELGDIGLNKIFDSIDCNANDIIELYNNIIAYNNRKGTKIKSALIIRDVKNVGVGPNGRNIFKCPPKDRKTGQDQFKSQLKKYLNENTKDINLMLHSEKKWWQQIDSSYDLSNIGGGLLPLNAKKRFANFSEKSYVNIQLGLCRFRAEISNEVNAIKTHEKEKYFPFANKYDEYSIELSKPKSSRENDEPLKVLIRAAINTEMSKPLKLFRKYCLPDCSTKNLNKKQIEIQMWLRSEYGFILDDVCAARNKKMLKEPREKIKKLKEQRAKQLNDKKQDDDQKKNADNDSKELEELSKIEEQCQISSFDFFKNLQSICNFINEYKQIFVTEWNTKSKPLKEKLFSLIQHPVMQYNHELFCAGVPIEFCDGDYIRMNQDFVKYVFQQRRSAGEIDNTNKIEKKTVACIAVAGPQSSGKSTLLRRLFGIEAKVSAGRTTKGINCCSINTPNRDVILCDTEGVQSTELISKNEKNSGGKKRDNKIVLTALASARVFILNIMRDAKDTKMLDVILWAYEKLNPQQKDNDADRKKLNEIKFIFVIRDCQEFVNTTWLTSQINQINKYLKEVLLKSSSYTEKKQNSEEKQQNITINDIIGEPIYFPMPDAFEHGAPNPEFSKKCVELRSIIFKYLHDTNKNNSFINRIQWSNEMCGIWDRIVQFEDVLSPADFRTQADHHHMNKEQQQYLKTLRESLSEEVEKLSIKYLNETKIKHEMRCQKFNLDFNAIYQGKVNDLATALDKSDKNEHVNKQIRKQYVNEYREKCTLYREEQQNRFGSRSQKQQSLDIENDITTFLNELKNKLKKEKCDDIKEIEKEYNQLFDNKIQQYQRYNTEHSSEKTMIRNFENAYMQNILTPNNIKGDVPSSWKQLDITFKTIKNKKIWEKIAFMNTYKNWMSAKPPEQSEMKREIETECKLLEAQINEQNMSDSQIQMTVIRSLDIALKNIDDEQKSNNIHLSQDFRCASHSFLYALILKKLKRLYHEIQKNVIEAIESLKKKQWKRFEQEVLGLASSKDIAQDFLKETLNKEITEFAKKRIEHYATEYFESFRDTMTAKSILNSAFIDAFQKGKDPDKALKFVRSQKKILEKTFEKEFKTRETAFLDCEKNKIDKDIRDVVDAWNNFFKQWNEKNETTTEKLKEKLTKHLKISKELTFTFQTDWFHRTIKKPEMFIHTVLEDIQELKKIHVKKNNQLITDGFKSFKTIFQTKCLGCMNFCPVCGAKCEKDTPHHGSHETTFHILTAFGGCHEVNESMKLVVDICSSSHNQTGHWRKNDNSLVWPEFLKTHYPEWDPIDDKKDFNVDNARLMLKMYFDHGLQELMLKQSRWNKYKPAEKSDVCFKKEIIDWEY